MIPCGKKPVPLNGLIGCDNGVMSFDVEVFRASYEEFAGLKDSTLRMYGDQSIAFLRVYAFGNMYQLAVALLTAHRLARTFKMGDAYDGAGMNDLSDTAEGTNISASTSSLSESKTPLALMNGDNAFNADLSRTEYGLQLLALIKTWVPAGEIVCGLPVGKPLGVTPWPPVDAGY